MTSSARRSSRNRSRLASRRQPGAYRDTQYLTDAPDVAARRNQTRLIDPQTNERLTFASPEAAEAFVNPSIVPRETVVESSRRQRGGTFDCAV